MSSSPKIKVYEYNQIKNGKEYRNIVKRELKGFIKAETVNNFINQHQEDILKIEPRFRSNYVVDGLLNESNYQISKPTALKYLRQHNMGTKIYAKK